MTTAIVLFGTLALLLIIGVPISISLGAATMLSMLTYDVPLAVVGQRMFTALDSVSIMAIPFFVLAGNLMTPGRNFPQTGRLCQPDYRKCKGRYVLCDGSGLCVFCGSFRLCSGYGSCHRLHAVSGNGKAGISESPLRRTAYRIRRPWPHYSAKYFMVVYCTITNSSVGDMFKAGLVAGAMIGIVLVGICIYLSHKEQWPKNEEKTTFKDLLEFLYRRDSGNLSSGYHFRRHLFRYADSDRVGCYSSCIFLYRRCVRI